MFAEFTQYCLECHNGKHVHTPVMWLDDLDIEDKDAVCILRHYDVVSRGTVQYLIASASPFALWIRVEIIRCRHEAVDVHLQTSSQRRDYPLTF